jgi:hypothetical protein
VEKCGRSPAYQRGVRANKKEFKMIKCHILFVTLYIISIPIKTCSGSEIIQDTCISGTKILPEKTMFVGNYKVGDSIFTKNQVTNILAANQTTQEIMKTSKLCIIIGVLFSCVGSIATIGLEGNNPAVALTGLGMNVAGIAIIFTGLGLNTKAIKVYNKSLCNK